jgi:hypothetical protein
MFERKVTRADAFAPIDLPEPAAEVLRPVKWSDLVAKFDAIHDLRAELGAGEAGGGASFDPDSARHIAEIGAGKQDVNFDDLANGKTAGGISRSVDGAVGDDPRV